VISCGVFGYAINSIGQILQDLNLQQNNMKKNLSIINKYLNNKNISVELQYQIREYLEFFWREYNQDIDKEKQIINQLPDQLKQTLFLEANKIVIKDSPLFIENFSE
jgi:hypothetical protein